MSTVGNDIESICNKCGEVWHVVVAMVGTGIAKVQCKECGAYHRYRPPEGKAVAKGSTKATTKKKSRAKAATAPEPQKIEADMSKPVRDYSMKSEYAPGERVEHPKFGVGVVEEKTEPGKMTVFFPAGRRILATAKPGLTLSRPQHSLTK